MPRRTDAGNSSNTRASTRVSIRRSGVTRRSGRRISSLTSRSFSVASRFRRIPRTRGSLVPGFMKATPFPRKCFKTLKYSQNFHLVGAALGLFGAIQKLRLNSLYDSDQTGGGHQPYGRDTLALIYQRYKVWSAKVVVKVVSPSETSCAMATMITGPSDSSDTLAGSTIDQIREKNMCSVNYFTSNQTRISAKTMKIQIADVMGLTKQQFADDVDNTTAAMSGNPADDVGIQFAVCDVKGANDTNCDIWISVDIYYRVQFYELVEQAQS